MVVVRFADKAANSGRIPSLRFIRPDPNNAPSGDTDTPVHGDRHSDHNANSNEHPNGHIYAERYGEGPPERECHP